MSVPQPIEYDGVGLQTPATDSPQSRATIALPHLLTTFVGRGRQLTDLMALLRPGSVRLLTLTGPGGVGKTRLAQAAAEALGASFPDGVYYVPLAPVVDPAMVIPAIAGALDVSGGGERTLLAQLTKELEGQRVLLVLDNLEQVLPAAPVIADLLRSVKGVSALVTSRSPLGVTGEYEYPVAPLELPDAMRPITPEDLARSESAALFVQRAQSVRPGFTLNEGNAAAVAEICRRLDGLPLALELAAARTKVLNLADLLARLERKLYVLTGGRSDAPARQRTMRDAIAWSYGLLDAGHQALFRRLAVFRGGFSIGMAEQLFGDPASPGSLHHQAEGSRAPTTSALDILVGLEHLLDQSLLGRDERATGESRLMMLETIREFGLEQLFLHGEEPAVYRGFADYWRTQAEASWEAARSLETLNQSLSRLEADHDNIRAAPGLARGGGPGQGDRSGRGAVLALVRPRSPRRSAPPPGATAGIATSGHPGPAGSQRPRQHAAGSGGGRRAPRRDAARRAARAPRAAARRQGPRRRPLPGEPAPPPHHGPDRPQGDRARRPPRPPPLDGRAHPELAQPVPAPEDPLRAASGHPPRLPPPRPQPDRGPVLKGVLSAAGGRGPGG